MKTPLTSTALLGSRRAHGFPPASHEALQPLWEALEKEEKTERALLRAAMVEHAAWHGGQRPLEDVVAPDACPLDTRPHIPPAAVGALQQMLTGHFAHLLGEWITMANRGGFAAPPRLIPDLLDLGRRHSEQRPALAQLVGDRGQWLAQEMKRWPWLAAELSGAPEPSSDAWLTGTLSERLKWLNFQCAHAPEVAARAVTESWQGDAPEAREHFTTIATRHPHPAQVDWLENLALKERRQATREAALRALMAIPESHVYGRSLERARSLLSVHRKTLRLSPPERFDSSWAHDGLQAKAPSAKGARAHWAQQILAMIPLSQWSEVTGSHDVFHLTLDPDWADTIRRAWVQSATRHHDAQTLPSVLHALAKDPGGHRQTWIMEILQTVPHDDRADFLEPLTLTHSEQCALLLRLLPPLDQQRHPRLHHIATHWIAQPKAPINRSDAVALAGCCDPAAIWAILDVIAKEPALTLAGEQFARALEFRQSYLSHFLT